MDERTTNHIRKIQKSLFVINLLMFSLIGYLHLFAVQANSWVTYILFILSLLSISFHLAIRMNFAQRKTTT